MSRIAATAMMARRMPMIGTTTGMWMMLIKNLDRPVGAHGRGGAVHKPRRRQLFDGEDPFDNEVTLDVSSG